MVGVILHSPTTIKPTGWWIEELLWNINLAKRYAHIIMSENQSIINPVLDAD
jgi:hypothetical protein